MCPLFWSVLFMTENSPVMVYLSWLRKFLIPNIWKKKFTSWKWIHQVARKAYIRPIFGSNMHYDYNLVRGEAAILLEICKTKGVRIHIICKQWLQTEARVWIMVTFSHVYMFTWVPTKSKLKVKEEV